MGDDGVPADYVSFVTAYGHRLTAACQEITGNDSLAEALRVDLLAVVALRWRLWRRKRREKAGAAQLDRLLRREVRSYHLLPDRHGPVRLSVSSTGTVPGAPVPAAPFPTAPFPTAPEGTAPAADEGTTAAKIAGAAWRRATQIRRQSTFGLAAAALVLLLLVAVSPHPNRGTPIPVPTGVPFKVTVLPRFADLVALGQGNSTLPTVVAPDPATLPDLSQSPLTRALALVQSSASTLIAIGPNTQRRYENPALAGSRLVPTSLSPAGDRAVLARGADLLVVDVRTATLRVVPAGALQPDPPVVVWRGPQTVVVPGPDGAHLVDLDAGTVTVLGGITGVDVVAGEGTANSPPPQLVEMVALSSTVGQSSRIRFWRSVPDGQTASPSPSAGPSPGPSPAPAASASSSPGSGDVEDRPIFGPLWIGAWQGQGWSSPNLFIRACSAAAISLPDRFGVATSAVGALATSGLYAGTLVAIDTTALDLLGFLRNDVVLVAARSAVDGTVIVSWNPDTGTLNRISRLNGDVRVSVADLLPPA